MEMQNDLKIPSLGIRININIVGRPNNETEFDEYEKVVKSAFS
jgi:hypothetical protein